MDQSVNLPAQTDSQFIAQLPELAIEFLSLSTEFESESQQQLKRARLTEGLRGWSVLEKLAIQSLIERARMAADQFKEKQRIEALAAAKRQRPFVPTNRIANQMRTKATQALNDPSIVEALVQWSQNAHSTKR